jgi:hypothetical protein
VPEARIGAATPRRRKSSVATASPRPGPTVAGIRKDLGQASHHQREEAVAMPITGRRRGDGQRHHHPRGIRLEPVAVSSSAATDGRDGFLTAPADTVPECRQTRPRAAMTSYRLRGSEFREWPFLLIDVDILGEITGRAYLAP